MRNTNTCVLCFNPHRKNTIGITKKRNETADLNRRSRLRHMVIYRYFRNAENKPFFWYGSVLKETILYPVLSITALSADCGISFSATITVSPFECEGDTFFTSVSYTHSARHTAYSKGYLYHFYALPFNIYENAVNFYLSLQPLIANGTLNWFKPLMGARKKKQNLRESVILHSRVQFYEGAFPAPWALSRNNGTRLVLAN